MVSLLEFVQRHKVIASCIVGLFILTVLIRVLKKVVNRRKRDKELEQAAADKIRDENLNHVILNRPQKKNGMREVYKPYDVDYGNPGGEKDRHGGRDNKGNGNHIMVQLTEKTELSTRKFMLNPMKKILIGSDLQDNDISVLGEGISPRQCEIFSDGSKVYIRNSSPEYKTILKRKREKAIVDGRGIRLLSGDVILLGGVSYDVVILHS